MILYILFWTTMFYQLSHNISGLILSTDFGQTGCMYSIKYIYVQLWFNLIIMYLQLRDSKRPINIEILHEQSQKKDKLILETTMWGCVNKLLSKKKIIFQYDW